MLSKVDDSTVFVDKERVTGEMVESGEKVLEDLSKAIEDSEV